MMDFSQFYPTGLLDAFQPSEQDKADARNRALMATGLAMMANSRNPGGSFATAFGRGGMAGIHAYDEGMQTARRDKLANLQLAGMLDGMRQKQKTQEMLGKANEYITQNLPGMDRQVGYKFDGNKEVGGYTFNMSDPNAQSDYMKFAQRLIEKKGRGEALSEPETEYLNQMGQRLSPVTQKVQDPALVYRNVASMVGSASPDLGKFYLSLSEAHQPKKMDAGAYYRDSNGAVDYLGDPTKGITMQNGSIVPMQGAENLLRMTALQKGMETSAVEQAKAPWADPYVMKGAGQGGSDLIVPRVNVPALGSTQSPSVRTGGNGGMPAVATPSGMGNAGAIQTASPADVDYSRDRAKSHAETMKGIQTAGFNAPGKISRYQELGRLLEGHEGGTLSPYALDLARTANSLGLQIDPKLPNKEAAATLTNQLALGLRSTADGGGMPGAMSDADRQFLMASVPNLAQSNSGRKQMIAMQVAIHEREKHVAAMARRWEAKYGRIDTPNPSGETFFDGLNKWTATNPLFGGQ